MWMPARPAASHPSGRASGVPPVHWMMGREWQAPARIRRPAGRPRFHSGWSGSRLLRAYRDGRRSGACRAFRHASAIPETLGIASLRQPASARHDGGNLRSDVDPRGPFPGDHGLLRPAGFITARYPRSFGSAGDAGRGGVAGLIRPIGTSLRVASAASRSAIETTQATRLGDHARHAAAAHSPGAAQGRAGREPAPNADRHDEWTGPAPACGSFEGRARDKGSASSTHWQI